MEDQEGKAYIIILKISEWVETIYSLIWKKKEGYIFKNSVAIKT